MRQKIFTLFMLLLLSSSMLFSQGQSYVRSAVIDPPTMFGSGFGATVSGVDLDNDGKLEIYSVNGMSDYFTGDEYPQIIKYENNGGTWDSVWAASFPNERQNSWAALTVGDLDGDGKKEIIWGYVNSFSTNTTPHRIVVFEANGDDILGVDDGNGGYTSNTGWNMDVPASTNMRALKWEAFDIDNDGKEEVIFAERRDHFNFGIVSVDDVPDAGTGSETWTMEFNASTELYNQFVRSAEIVPADIDFAGGVGEVVTGVDLDKDGLMDAYVVNNNTNDSNNGELEPMMTKAELVKGAWVERWSINIKDIIGAQNTWPVLKHGDLDGDGKEEIIWMPINNSASGDTLPKRVVVFEVKGDTTDVMGVEDGMGGMAPNAMWDMGVAAKGNMRPFNAEIFDIDNDGKAEICFSERVSYYGWGIASVDNIPDDGDGSETWTMEANGVGANSGSTYADMTIANGKMYVLPWDGVLTEISWDGSAYQTREVQTGVPFWAFKGMHAVDIDEDGTDEIVAANYSTGGQVYLLTADADTFVVTQIADLSTIGMTRLPGADIGDIDADGMLDIVAGSRGNDVVGRVEYNGGTMTDPASWVVSVLDSGSAPIKAAGNYEVIHLANIDGDASDEVFYTSCYQRSLDVGTTYPLVVGHYSDTLTADAGRRWDMVVANGAAHFFDGSGNMQSVSHDGTSYKLSVTQPEVANGAFLTASAYDVNNDGTEEIFIGNWYDAKVTLLSYEFGFWTSNEIFDFTDMGGVRLNGGAAGDIDNDGFADFVTGSRTSVPNAQIYRVEYMGGPFADMNSWRGEVIDQEINDTHTQWEVVNLANLDDDDDMEVLYTSDYARGPNDATTPQAPIVIIDVTSIQATPIADVRVDENNDFLPDRLGEVVTIKGVVTTPDYNLSSTSSHSFYIQDETGAINIYAKPKLATFFEVGDLVQITGEVDEYNGLTEIIVNDSTGMIKLGSGTVPEPMVLTLDEFYANPEAYESQLVKVIGLKKAGDDAWPDATSNANIDMTDGYSQITMRVDKDVDVGGDTEPVYPIALVAIVGQFDSSDPKDGGYQLFPRYFTDIEQNVAVPPSPNFALLTPADGAVVTLTDSAQVVEPTWEAAIDLNDDAILYQFFTVGDAVVSGPLTTTSFSLTATDLLGVMNGADSLTVRWSVRAKGAEQNFVTSVDTFTVTFVDDVPVGIEEELIPKKFYVAQNYPNPFNPTTTIRFGLAEQRSVDLRIYDILGQQVAILINNQSMKAAHHEVNFNASRLASGTYIYRLTADDKVVTKKMLLVK